MSDPITRAADVIRCLGWDGGDAAQIIAESLHERGLLTPERIEWGVTAQFGAHRLILSNREHGNAFESRGRWFPAKKDAATFMKTVTAADPRLVWRRVSLAGEITDE